MVLYVNLLHGLPVSDMASAKLSVSDKNGKLDACNKTNLYNEVDQVAISCEINEQDRRLVQTLEALDLYNAGL